VTINVRWQRSGPLCTRDPSDHLLPPPTSLLDLVSVPSLAQRRAWRGLNLCFP